ncbi:MAG: hypothetical protein ACJATQ_001431 [Cellvibrionaceae bacterium]|jgi:hypothetical protein
MLQDYFKSYFEGLCLKIMLKSFIETNVEGLCGRNIGELDKKVTKKN